MGWLDFSGQLEEQQEKLRVSRSLSSPPSCLQFSRQEKIKASRQFLTALATNWGVQFFTE